MYPVILDLGRVSVALVGNGEAAARRLAGLDAAQAGYAAGSLELTADLRTQLRMLAENPDDDVAGAAEDLLEGI